jgi:hypothetical protein
MKTDKILKKIIQKNNDFLAIKIQKPNIKFLSTTTASKHKKNYSYNYNLSSKLYQFINSTVSHFNIKFNLLSEQIDVMKKEFIDQIEGLINFIPNEFPLIKTPKNNIKKQISPIKINKNNSHINTDSNIILNKSKNKKISSNSLNENNNFYNNKHLNTPKNSPNKNNKNKNEEIIKILIEKNDFFDLDSKLKLSYLNKNLYNSINKKEIINEEYKKMLNIINNLKNSFNKNISNTFPASNLSFILKNSKNEIIEENEINKIFFEFIFKLKEINFNNNNKNDDLYMILLNQTKKESIKQILIDYMKNINNNIKNFNDDYIKNNFEFLEKNKILRDYNQLIKNGNKTLSYFAFVFDEIYNIFQYEINKRNKIKNHENILKNIIKIKNIFDE